jgi:hypothetical protein
MALTSRQIAQNEATAGLRTVLFAVWNTADGTAKTDLAAATALIHTNGGAGVNSTNNFAHGCTSERLWLCRDAGGSGHCTSFA